MGDLQDGHVREEAIDAIHGEFGKDAIFTSSNFHNKSESEKLKKNREQQELGIFI